MGFAIDPPGGELEIVVTRKRSMMTAAFGDGDAHSGVCGDCRGKGYDPKHRGNTRRCLRCKGRGAVEFSRIKR